MLTCSSEPSEQSLSPSQSHLEVIQCPFKHWNSIVLLQLCKGQPVSSLLSPQSLSWSQRQLGWMHFPLAQVNSSARQVSSRNMEFEKYYVVSFNFNFREQLIHLLQEASSDLSTQSGCSSHTQLIGMHSPSPLLQVNSSLEQVLSSEELKKNIIFNLVL